MLLKRLKLSNFRQFKEEQEINFATDEIKNVTIVLADNGVGKTTLAQAFQWVLYGSTDGFKTKSVLNLKTEKALRPSEQATVSGEIELVHNGIEYTIKKTQVYKKDSANNVNSEGAEIQISYKKNGQIEFIDTIKITSTIRSILPVALSRYFFFDGEKIQKMSNEISIGRSQEFEDAVQGLLGLNALKNAIEHLKPSRNSVIGKYNTEIDEHGDAKARECGNRIIELTEQLEKIENELNENQDQIDFYNRERDEKKKLILEYAETERIQNQYNTLEKDIEILKNERIDKIKIFLSNFNKTTTPFLQKNLIADCLNELNKADKIDKGIPDIQARTIKFLLNRKKCICGTDLSEVTSEAVKKLLEEMEYVPPQSIGQSINSFIQLSKERTKSGETYFENITNYYKDIRNIDNRIKEKEDYISEIDKTLLSTNKVGELKLRQNEIESTLSKLKTYRDDLIRKQGASMQEKTEKESERERLTLVDEKNKQLQIYRDYAVSIYTKIENAYKISESNIRDQLKLNINVLFEQIYGKGLFVDIDARYKIKVKVSEILEDETLYTQDIDYSTAQNYSVIFAFIVGIIKMAKQKMSEIDENLVDTEVYPLVMDAPLSAFDEKRIQNICNTIPGIARQVIIFIKDTDGKIAKNNLGNNIGKEYELKTRDQESLLETYILEKEV